MEADSADVCAAIWLAMSFLLPVATYLFIKSFFGLWIAAAAADHYGPKTPSHRKAQRAHWRRGHRPRRHSRPRHYLVEGHLSIGHDRLSMTHHRPMSTSSSYSCMYNYPTMSIFDHPSDPNLTTSYLHGWARRLVSATFKPMVQWLMYLVSVAKLLLGWLCIVLKIMTLFVGWSIPGGLINAAPVAAASCPTHQGSTHKRGECCEYKASPSTESNSVLSSIDIDAVGTLETSDGATSDVLFNSPSVNFQRANVALPEGADATLPEGALPALISFQRANVALPGGADATPPEGALSALPVGAPPGADASTVNEESTRLHDASDTVSAMGASPTPPSLPAPSLCSRDRLRQPSQRYQESLDLSTQALGNFSRTCVDLSSTYDEPVPVLVPAHDDGILHYPDSPDFDGPVSIRSIVRKLNYLAQITRPDLMQAVHSIAKFSAYTKKEHGDAIMYLAMYLNKTRRILLRLKPDPSRGSKGYCDADFYGSAPQEALHWSIGSVHCQVSLETDCIPRRLSYRMGIAIYHRGGIHFCVRASSISVHLCTTYLATFIQELRSISDQFRMRGSIVYYPYGVIPYFMVHYCLPACDLWTTRNSSDAVRRVPHDNDRPYLQPVRNLF